MVDGTKRGGRRKEEGGYKMGRQSQRKMRRKDGNIKLSRKNAESEKQQNEKADSEKDVTKKSGRRTKQPNGKAVSEKDVTDEQTCSIKTSPRRNV